jgi:hypothetical protein
MRQHEGVGISVFRNLDSNPGLFVSAQLCKNLGRCRDIARGFDPHVKITAQREIRIPL